MFHTMGCARAEVINIFKSLLERQDLILIVALDEIDTLLRKDGDNILHILTHTDNVSPASN